MKIEKAYMIKSTFSLQPNEGINVNSIKLDVDNIVYDQIVANALNMAKKLNVTNFTLSIDFELSYDKKSTTEKLISHLNEKIKGKNT